MTDDTKALQDRIRALEEALQAEAENWANEGMLRVRAEAKVAELEEADRNFWAVLARAEAAEAKVAVLTEALSIALDVLTADTIGTIYMDDPNWYRAVDLAVTKARAALAATETNDD